VIVMGVIGVMEVMGARRMMGGDGSDVTTMGGWR